jgi:hypothetical protein
MRQRVAVAVLALLPLGIFFSCSPPKRATPTPTVTVLRTTKPTTVPEAQLPKESHLAASPSSGPVGTRVMLTGTGCGYVGHPVNLRFFRGSPHGTSGSDDTGLRNIQPDPDGSFRVTYRIPSRFKEGSLNGSGGGPLYSGTYEFSSEPPFCTTEFRVTG